MRKGQYRGKGPLRGKFGRIPLPRATGGPHGSKKGKRGYSRKAKHINRRDGDG